MSHSRLALACFAVLLGAASAAAQSSSPPASLLVEIPGSREEPAELVRTRAAATFPGFVPDASYAPVSMRPSPRNAELGWSTSSHSWVLRGGYTRPPTQAPPAAGAPAPDAAAASPAPLAVLALLRLHQLGPGVVTPDVVISPFGGSCALPGPCPLAPCAGTPLGVTYGPGSILLEIDPCQELASLDEVRSFLGLDALHATGLRGEGIAIGIVDGGVWSPLLEAQIQAFDAAQAPAPPPFGFTGGSLVTGGWSPGPLDPVGGYFGGAAKSWFEHAHMTATEALVAAPGAEIYDIRISSTACTVFCPTGGCGLLSNALAGFDWAIQQHGATGKPQILSNSWGIQHAADAAAYVGDLAHPFNRKVEEAVDAGIVVLFAGGNSGKQALLPDCAGQLGPFDEPILGANGHPRVLTVAAVDTPNGAHGVQYAGYDSTGPALLQDPLDVEGSLKPDVAAPTHTRGYFGAVQLAADLAPVFHTSECQVGSVSFCPLPGDAGTSAACALTAGVVALLLQDDPSLTPEAVKDCLKRSAVPLGAPQQSGLSWGNYNEYVGAGVIDALGAFACNKPLQCGTTCLEPLCGDVTTVSQPAGDDLVFQLCAGSQYAGLDYVLLGSASGTSPGQTVGGVPLPLNFDGYFLLTSSPPVAHLQDSFGTLDASGHAVVVLHAGLLTVTPLSFSVLDHAYVVLDPALGVVFVSNPVSVQVTY